MTSGRKRKVDHYRKHNFRAKHNDGRLTPELADPRSGFGLNELLGSTGGLAEHMRQPIYVLLVCRANTTFDGLRSLGVIEDLLPC